MKYKTIIWDFNGTLLADMEISIKAMNTVLSRRNLPIIPSVDAFRDVFCFPVEEYYGRVGLDFSKEPFKIPADEWVELYSADMYAAPLINEAKEALEGFRKAGIKQVILSASEKNRLITHLEKLEIIDYFDEIHGAGDVYANGKKDLAVMLSKRSELFPAVLIGDTDHDCKCAELIGCDTYLFSGGFMSANRLAESGCPVSDSLLDISKIILNT